MEVTMEGNTDFKVSPPSGTTIFEVELTVVAGNVCMGVSHAEVSMPPTMEEYVPILTPSSMIMLISMLCIAGVGRIARKGRRS
jgi:ribosomal protein L2